VRAGRVGAFNALFRRQVGLLREQEGLLYAKLARRLQPDGGEEAVLFEEWQDAASLYAWVGPNLTEPRLVPGVRELIDEVHVTHYEALSEDTEPIDVEATRDGAASGDPDAGRASPGEGLRQSRPGEEAS